MRRGVLLIAVLLLFLLSTALADWIKLKDGSHVAGRITSETGKTVKIETSGGLKTINRDEIQWLRRDAPHHGGAAK